MRIWFLFSVVQRARPDIEKLELAFTSMRGTFAPGTECNVYARSHAGIGCSFATPGTLAHKQINVSSVWEVIAFPMRGCISGWAPN